MGEVEVVEGNLSGGGRGGEVAVATEALWVDER